MVFNNSFLVQLQWKYSLSTIQLQWFFNFINTRINMMFDSTSNEAGILFACSIVKLLRILDFNYLQLLDFLSLRFTFYITLVKSV
jgi:hypothetical protein